MDQETLWGVFYFTGFIVVVGVICFVCALFDPLHRPVASQFKQLGVYGLRLGVGLVLLLIGWALETLVAFMFF